MFYKYGYALNTYCMYTQKAEAGEGVGCSVMEDLLGGHSDEQSGKGLEKHRKQTHTLSSKKDIQCILYILVHTHIFQKSFPALWFSILILHFFIYLFILIIIIIISLVLSHSLQKGSNYGSLLTADGNFQMFAKTGYFKVSF